MIAPRRCVGCSTEFVPPARSHQQWCSRRCAHRIYNMRYRDRQPIPYRPCATCGDSMPAFGSKKYCSNACRPTGYRRHLSSQRICLDCHRLYETIRVDQKFCSPECGERARWGLRTRIPKHIKQRILSRDEWRCYLCNRAIPKDLAWPDPQSGTVDHVVPRSAGGPDTEDNLRAAHWACNRDKGERLLGVEMGYTLEEKAA